MSTGKALWSPPWLILCWWWAGDVCHLLGGMWGRVCHWHVVGVEFRDADKQSAMHGTGCRREFITPNSAEVGAPALPSIRTARAVLTWNTKAFVSVSSGDFCFHGSFCFWLCTAASRGGAVGASSPGAARLGWCLSLETKNNKTDFSPSACLLS